MFLYYNLSYIRLEFRLNLRYVIDKHRIVNISSNHDRLILLNIHWHMRLVHRLIYIWYVLQVFTYHSFCYRYFLQRYCYDIRVASKSNVIITYSIYVNNVIRFQYFNFLSSFDYLFTDNDHIFLLWGMRLRYSLLTWRNTNVIIFIVVCVFKFNKNVFLSGNILV